MILSFITSFFASFAQADEICIACAGKAFNAVSAAFSTQGYYLQADIIEQIFYNGMGSWAMLAYIASACGGLVGVATGASPKNYMWYFMGPAVYHWLVGTTYLTHGVSWEVGGATRDQREVWKIVKTGLETSNYAVRYGVEVDPVQGPTYPAEVADFFAWFDDVTSDTVQQLVSWLSVPYMRNQFGGENVTRADVISDAKWRYMQDIVGARFANPGLQVAFTYFLEGGCGQILRKSVDNSAFAQAVSQEGRNLSADFSFFRGPLNGTPPYSDIVRALGSRSVSSRQLVRQVFSDPTFMSETQLAQGLSLLETGSAIGKSFKSRIDCNDYLGVLVQAFRWEAGRIYIEMVKGLPSGVTEDQFVAQLFHGWEIPLTVGPMGARQFMINLIMAHLIGNEFKLSPRSFAIPQYNAGERIIKEFIPNSQRMTQSQSKFGELYVWALMVPYFQGLLLLMLAVAYPFACMLVVMPGFHKVMFTWMSMYLWVKLWDFGFAMVQLIDRGVWATLGNTANARGVNNVVTGLAGLHSVTTTAVPATPFTPATSTVIAPLITDYTTYLQMLDLGMQLAFNVDYSLANSYYIYIMSALYFAVPVVLGQLVLSGKGWVADLAKGAIGTMAGDVKGGVQGAATDSLFRSAKQQFEAQRVASKMASTDVASFMAKALTGRNEAEQAKMEGAYANKIAGRYRQQADASGMILAGGREALAAGKGYLSEAGANVGAFKEQMNMSQAGLAGVRAKMQSLSSELDSARNILSAEDKALSQRESAVRLAEQILNQGGDIGRFVKELRQKTNDARNAEAQRNNITPQAGGDPTDPYRPATGQEAVSGALPAAVGWNSTDANGGYGGAATIARNRDPATGEELTPSQRASQVSGGGQARGANTAGQGASSSTTQAFSGAANNLLGDKTRLLGNVVGGGIALAELSQGRMGPAVALASANDWVDSSTFEIGARMVTVLGSEPNAQKRREIVEGERRSAIFNSQMSQLSADDKRIDGQFADINRQLADNQRMMTTAQVGVERAQAMNSATQGRLSDEVARGMLGMQVEADNFATNQDYTASRLSNQAGIDETRGGFAAELDASYATQLGGQSISGVLSAAGVAAGTFTGSSMTDNLKALAYEEGLEGDDGKRAAATGQFFEEGGLFQRSQMTLQGALLSGAAVSSGLGGEIGKQVSEARTASTNAGGEAAMTALVVNDNVKNLNDSGALKNIDSSIRALDQKVQAMPAAGSVLEGAPQPYQTDLLQSLGGDSSKEAQSGLSTMIGKLPEEMRGPLNFLVDAQKAVGGAMDKVDEKVAGATRNPDEFDALQSQVTEKLSSSVKK